VLLCICGLPVLVFDTIRGVRIHEQPLPTPNDGANISLVADTKRSRLVVFYPHDDNFTFAFTTVHADNSSSAQPLLIGSRLSLAAGLATSFSCRSLASIGTTHSLSWTCNTEDTSGAGVTPNGIAEGIRILEAAFEKVKSASKEAEEDSFLRDAFDSALKEAAGGAENTANSIGNPQDAIRSKNGEKINGVHSPNEKSKQDASANGHHSPVQDPIEQLILMPRAFVDSAASLAVDILCLPSTSHIGGTVRNDARFLLQVLVRSGRLSARSHLVPRLDSRTKFTDLLRSLDLTASEIKQGVVSAYTPFDLANDIFANCSDVSERQMVGVLHHAITRALPEDVAACFIRSSTLNDDHPLFAKITQFLADDKDQKTILDRKLIMFGMAALMKAIVEYSTCNESLLRDALAFEFSEEGLLFLAKFLVDLLMSPEKFHVAPKTGSVRNSIQWLSALCDCLQQTPPSSEDVKRIRGAIAKQLRAAGTIVSLQGAIEDNLALASGRPAAGEAKQKENSPRTLPPYQIERLVF